VHAAPPNSAQNPPWAWKLEDGVDALCSTSVGIGNVVYGVVLCGRARMGSDDTK
jgi:hypothetical protein